MRIREIRIRCVYRHNENFDDLDFVELLPRLMMLSKKFQFELGFKYLWIG